MPRALQVVLLWIITLAWVANLVVGFFNPALSQPIVNAPFMVVAAILFRQIRRQRSADDNESSADVIDEARRTVGDLISGDRGSGDDE